MTLDPDRQLIAEAVHRWRRPFKQVVNDAQLGAVRGGATVSEHGEFETASRATPPWPRGVASKVCPGVAVVATADDDVPPQVSAE